MHLTRHAPPTLWIVAALAIAAAGPIAEPPLGAQSRTLPNPYQAVDGWAKLPDGRPWGAPAAVAMDPDARSLWVFERCGDNSCIDKTVPPVLKFDPSGTLVRSFGSGLFNFPHGLDVDKDGNVWVTDGEAKGGKGNQVFKFSPEGRLLLTLGKAGVAAEGPDTFVMPSDVAIAPNGDIFVADGHNPTPVMRIVKFSRDGKFLKTWGRKGAGRGELNDPHGLTFDSRGRLFVADRYNSRIQIFDQDGGFIDEWRQFGRPSGIYISSDDVLYSADQDYGIRIGSARDGSLSAEIKGAPGASGVVRVAEGVVVDTAGSVYGGEIAGRKVMKYVRKGG